jgi:hypothetical protein
MAAKKSPASAKERATNSAKKVAKKSAKKAVSATRNSTPRQPAERAPRKSMPKEGRDPKGGLTQLGRDWFREKDGSNLKPGVRGPANTPEKMRRKGSFLTRFFTHPRGPMTDQRGRPTRLALSAQAWGEPIPKTISDAQALAAEGRKLLERYHAAKPAKKPSAARKSSRP